MIDRIGWSLGYLHAEARLDHKMSTFSKILVSVYSSLLLPSSDPVPAPQIRSTILALYKFVCMYVSCNPKFYVGIHKCAFETGLIRLGCFGYQSF